MPVSLSTVAWTGRPHPDLDDVHVALDSNAERLHAAGLRSVIFLPEAPVDRGRVGYAAAIVSNGRGDRNAIRRVAHELLGECLQHVETIEIDARGRSTSALVSAAAPTGR